MTRPTLPLRAAALALLLLLTTGAHAADPMDFWATPRVGANSFLHHPSPSYYEAASAAGIEVLRVFPNNWDKAGRDFLVGDCDRFEALVPEDLQRVRDNLDMAHAAGVKVVLTTVSLPGSRWRQHNGGKDDLRLWLSPDYQRQAAELWRQLAEALKDHPALVAYNPLNEPHPERLAGLAEGSDLATWGRMVAGGTADLNRFNARVVAAIRAVDPTTPVLLDAGVYASPEAFVTLEPVADPRTLYAFHMYEPGAYTNRRQNRERFTYPGWIPNDGAAPKGDGRTWNRAALSAYLEPVRRWQARHDIPARRVFAAEFGANRMAPGVDRYLADLTALLTEAGWHWAFYSFREDGWPGMDYELGQRAVGPTAWEAYESGHAPALKRGDSAAWDALTAAMARVKAARKR